MSKSLAIPEQGTFGFLKQDSFVPLPNRAKTQRTGSFVDNMQLPIHRWFRYSAGFSAEWAGYVMANSKGAGDTFVFDPFVGSGTSILAAQSQGIGSAGIENHPFVYRIARAKLKWIVDEKELLALGESLLRIAVATVQKVPTSKAELLQKCYSPDFLAKLESLRDSYSKHFAQGEVSELLWLAITSILRECSGVGTAQWQYILPKKSKAKSIDPFYAFQKRIQSFVKDVLLVKASGYSTDGEVILGDSRSSDGLERFKEKVDLIVTSPPYPNNYDYADATRLEMTFWGEVEKWGDLQNAVRCRLVRSCSQHASAEQLDLPDLLGSSLITPIRDELEDVCRTLEQVRLERAGHKTYHTMVAAYFVDLAKVWTVLRSLCKESANVCFVLGDSAPYGVYVPVDRWLGELAISAGFKRYRFEKVRDRNIKWKNRKHRIPLKEGNLWIEG
jgi:hypothetical protein